MNRSTILIALAAAVATAGTVAFPAYAQDVTSSTQVRYGDLDLTSADGAAQLKSRVKWAADLVCGTNGQISPSEYSAARKCVKTAIAKAQPQVQLALARAGTEYASTGGLVIAAAN